MILKTADSDLSHVKALAFKVVMFILDGLMDGEMSHSALEDLKISSDCLQDSRNELACSLCGKRFKTKNGFHIHKHNCHANKNRENYNENCIHSKNPCEICDNSIDDQNGLTSQKEIHKSLCEFCDVVFVDKDDLKRHMRDKHLVPSKSLSPQYKKKETKYCCK